MRRNNHDTTHMLRRFFTDIAAEVSGLRSSYWTIIELGQSGAVYQPTAASSDGAIERAHKRVGAAAFESDIAGRLERLESTRVLRPWVAEGAPEHDRYRELDGADLRAILALAFGPSPWPVVGAAEQRDDRKRLGEYPGVAIVTERARRGFAAAVKKREKKAIDTRDVVVQRPDRGSFYRLYEDALADATMGGKRVDEIAGKEIVGDRTIVWRDGNDPRAGLKVFLDHGLVGWLRGTTIAAATLKEIAEEAGALVKAAQRAWAAVAPTPDREGRVRHTQHRRAAYGPLGQEQRERRPSGVYPTVAATSWSKVG